MTAVALTATVTCTLVIMVVMVVMLDDTVKKVLSLDELCNKGEKLSVLVSVPFDKIEVEIESS